MGCNPANAVPVGGIPDGQQCGPCDTAGLTEQQILDLMAEDQSITIDGQNVSGRSVRDLITLDQYLASKRVACSGGGWGSLQVHRAVPPDSAGVQ